jgi:hypothetical protein
MSDQDVYVLYVPVWHVQMLKNVGINVQSTCSK